MATKRTKEESPPKESLEHSPRRGDITIKYVSLLHNLKFWRDFESIFLMVMCYALVKLQQCKL